MHLMTNGVGKNGEKGLISIKEANEYSQQSIYFCVPIEKFKARKIFSTSIFFNLPFKIYFTIYNNEKAQNIMFKKYSKAKKLIARILDKEIIFKINDEITFERNIFKRIFSPLKNKYVGDDNSFVYKNHRFIIFDILNIQDLDELFFKYRIYFIN